MSVPQSGDRAHAPTLVFAHANGFPACSYRQLFAAWRAAGWRVVAPPMLGHDPAYPVASNWARLRDQLADFSAREAPGGAWLVGHSLGGLLSLMVASKHPERVRGVVLLDSPVITGWRAHSVQVLKASRLMPRVSPGKVSQTRRMAWPSREAAHAHFAAKRKFARWAPDVLADYLRDGLVEAADGSVTLAFTREVETRIYNTLPHHLGTMLRRHPLRCPLGFVAGTRSREVRQGGLDTAHRLAGERFAWIEGSHLYPMERPAETAATVLTLLGTMVAV
ncbi:alpha/beta hydrolase [Ideonella sp. DXS22W]|uniref:Alpha/beta hydrolase n=1 Tax=Pseudaquabacterium inlustre TaxID=2984192 RepID=A0ABU9CDW2_9BURK